jgi:hypothetical protein
MENKVSNIILIDGKDIVNSNYNFNTNASLRKFKGTLDFSLEAMKIAELEPTAFVIENNKQYTKAVVCVTFKYSLKENKKTLMTTKEIREKLYKDGFYIDGVKYVRFKRSAGSARVGKCLFVKEDLYDSMMEWSYMGIDHTRGIDMDLAKIETYMALTTSSIIDTLKIESKNILLIDDYESVFKDKVMATRLDQTGNLITAPAEATVKNSIWDGQSLLDVSIFDNNGYADKGFLLLRNRFFKSACFNTNIQQFFADNNITSIYQLNGQTVAQDIKDIKLITTPSSIKYLKFGTFAMYLSKLEETFGVVKYEKAPHNMNGMVQTHYQLINTLQLNKDEVHQLLQPTLDYIDLLKNNPTVLKHHIGIKTNLNVYDIDINNANNMFYNLLKVNDGFTETKLFYNYKQDVIKAFKNNVRKGHILINGNYSVLCGNAPEMLKSSINAFDGTAELNGDEVNTKAFDYNKELLGCRSPHVTMGNLWVCKNTENDFIDTYFNSSKYIIHINSINNNVLERLSGADFDSDQLLLTDEPILLNKAKANYNKFLVPTDFTPKSNKAMNNTIDDKVELDIATSKNMIGEIVNLSQILNSEYWDRIANNKPVDGLYELICQLDVLSCIEIDKAKKLSPVNSKREIERIKNSVYFVKGERPYFFKYVGEGKDYIFENKKTPMDYLEHEMNKIKRANNRTTAFTPLINLFQKLDKKSANRHQINRLIKEVEETNARVKAIYAGNADDAEKYEKDKEQKEILIDYVSNIKMSANTLSAIIYRLSKDYCTGTGKLTSLGRMLMTALYSANKQMFISIINSNKENITILKEEEDGDIKIFNKKYTEHCA